MNKFFIFKAKKYLRYLSSLHLAITCLVGVMVLVLLGTLEQISSGVYIAQEKYFKSFFIYWQPMGSSLQIPYFPGGYFFAGLFLINLLATYAFRFKFNRHKIGIFLIHFGIAMLIFGECLNGIFSIESQIVMKTGETVNYSECLREMELVVMSGNGQVVSIPESVLCAGKVIEHPALPFTLHIKIKYPNARLLVFETEEENPPFSVNRGIGTKVNVEPQPPVKRDDQMNFVATIVELKDGEYSLGTWLVSNAISEAQSFTYREENYEVSVRRKRYYYPFSMELVSFTHETYPGTNIPKNFSSSVKLYAEDGTFDRQAFIYMNHPLRYGGKTFYQASYGDHDTVSVFQVVDNPGRVMPYLASSLVGMGLLIQFFVSLYTNRRK